MFANTVRHFWMHNAAEGTSFAIYALRPRLFVIHVHMSKSIGPRSNSAPSGCLTAWGLFTYKSPIGQPRRDRALVGPKGQWLAYKK